MPLRVGQEVQEVSREINFMEKMEFFRKKEERKPPEPEGEVNPEKKEKIREWQGKRAEKLKEILFSRTADVAGNYVPGIDVVKMTIEDVLGKTLSKREISATERTLFILSSAAILGFYLTGDLRLRAGASAMFDALMVPQIFKDIISKIAPITPGFAAILEKAPAFLAQNIQQALNVFNSTFISLNLNA